MKIVIIGGSFGGISCAIEARKIYPESEIVLIEKAHIGFIPSRMLLYLEGKIPSLQDAFFCSKEQLEQLDIQVALQETMLKLDPKNHFVQTDQRRIAYDRLILAAGSAQESEILLPMNEAALTYKDRRCQAIYSGIRSGRNDYDRWGWTSRYGSSQHINDARKTSPTSGINDVSFIQIF